ncbi:MAG: TetR/AcrR family transcriptional regulator [Nannocystaceae bacterium]|nr:TetR/AcrR family transcriptional regulator [Nannocystaceae bacterium]
MSTKRSHRRSSPPPSRAQSAAQTREALLRAGARLFGARGLDAPSLDEICEAAGKTRGAFYVHFGDRDAFLVAVMQWLGVPLLEQLFAPDSDGDAGLATVAMRFLAAVGSGAYPLTRDGGVRPHQLVDACLRSPAIREHYLGLVEDSIARVGEAIASDQRRGRVRADLDARDLATVVLAAVIGAQTLLELRAPVALERAAATLLAAVSQDATQRPDAPPRRARTRRRVASP